MDASWEAVARRVVEGLGVEEGELVLVRDRAGRPEALLEVLLAVEQRGATPLPIIFPPVYLRRLLLTAPESYLAAWDRHRLAWTQQADRVLVLEGEALDLDVPELAAGRDAWLQAVGRLTVAEDDPPLPYLLVAVPTQARAAALGLPLEDLEAAVLPALAAEAAELRREIARVLDAIAGGRSLTIRSGVGCALSMDLGDRRWLDDDGAITAEDRARGAVASNLPAGSVYTTVVEGETRGTLHLPRAGDAKDVTVRFVDGVITEVAGEGAAAFDAMLDRETGDARRISHVGIGLNPHLRRPMGWTLVDEHVHGCLFVALGENRYMGGQNASSLNVDFAVPGAMLLVDDRVIVREGTVVV